MQQNLQLCGDIQLTLKKMLKVAETKDFLKFNVLSDCLTLQS